MSTKDEALKLAEDALKSCNAGDYSTGHVIHPSFDEDAVNKAIEAIDALAGQPAQQEPVAKPYAYEYGRDNGDGTYSVVIEKGDLVQTAPAVYNYVRPRNAHKDWPIKELFDRPPASKPWVGLTMNQLKSGSQIEEAKSSAALDLSKAFWAGARWAEAKLREKNA